MSSKEWPRIALTAVIVTYFGWALFAHWSNGLEETLKNITMLAIGYWLGSSKGSVDSNARTDRALDIAAGNAVSQADTVNVTADTANVEATK